MPPQGTKLQIKHPKVPSRVPLLSTTHDKTPWELFQLTKGNKMLISYTNHDNKMLLKEE